jgi:hypothetical protein
MIEGKVTSICQGPGVRGSHRFGAIIDPAQKHCYAAAYIRKDAEAREEIVAKTILNLERIQRTVRRKRRIESTWQDEVFSL